MQTFSGGDLETGKTNQTEAYKTVQNLFICFQSIFGEKWARSHDDEHALKAATHFWSLALNGLSTEEIQRGITNVLKNCKFPPTPSEFIDFCKEKIITAHQDAEPILKQQRDFEKGRKSVAMIHINKCMQSCGRPAKYSEEDIKQAILEEQQQGLI